MNEWEQFFDGYATRYMDEPFVTATVAEVDFIERLFRLEPGARVLDLGCGTGRHSVELARRGYRVTGVDLSRGMLDQAAAAAAAAGVSVELVKADATVFATTTRFDVALCLCEGSFGLLGATDDPFEHEHAILRTMLRALRPGGRFMITALNGLRMAREHSPEEVAAGGFDPATLTEHHPMGWTDEAGAHELWLRERGFAPSELALLCRSAGLQVDHVWGGTAGDWGERPVDMDEMEIMVVGRRPRESRGTTVDAGERDGDGAAQDSVAGAAVEGAVRMLDGPVIRPVTPEDAGIVSRILNEIVAGGRHSVLDRTFSEDEERVFIEGFPPRGVFLVAELPERGVVAFQALEPYLAGSDAFAHVATMGTWVLESCRRRGLGKALCAVTFAAARENGFEKVFTDIRADNAESLAFHRALGFVEVGSAARQARYGDRYVDIVYVEKDLREQ